MMRMSLLVYFCFFFNDTATTEIYTLSLHDALPILIYGSLIGNGDDPSKLFYGYLMGGAIMIIGGIVALVYGVNAEGQSDRKSTRLNSSHANISYAVFCLKKKKKLIE